MKNHESIIFLLPILIVLFCVPYFISDSNVANTINVSLVNDDTLPASFKIRELQWNQSRLDGIQIGTVITHGEDNPRTTYPVLISELIQRGATISDINSNITLNILSNYDIIWIDEWGADMLVSEIDAIKQWVQYGGRFLITGDSMGSAINLTQKFNITYTEMNGSGSTNAIYPHPITLGVNEINFPSPVSSLNISSQPNANLCVELNAYDMVAAMEFGAGKFVILVDENVLTSYDLADNHLLINNTFGWLGYAKNNYSPTLTAAPVIPTGGNQSTEFNFTVLYTDSDNNRPHVINVLINETPFPMVKHNISDMNYTDGCAYQYLTYLQPGIYNYSFNCTDGKFFNSTITYTGLFVTETNADAPKMKNGQVNPSTGFNGSTRFVFTVNYTDADNNAPDYVNITINSMTCSMVKQNPMDINYMDGCMFMFNTTLGPGNHVYHFNCSDGVLSASDGPYIGPFVKLIKNYTMFVDFPYDWMDATPGIRCSMDGQDDSAQIFYFPFTFKFYNETFDYIYVSTNGFASFSYEISFINVPFPTNTYPYMIAPFWDDLKASSPCNIFVRNLTSPNRVVIEWQNYYTQGGSLVGSFEIVLYEFGYIIFNYDYLAFASSYTCGLNLGLNTSYYNMYTGLNTSIDDFSILFTHQLNDFAPNLINGSVTPNTGDQFTEFNFNVVYLDPDNNPPVFITVLINGMSYPMVKQDPSDVNYMDGCVYQYSIYLQPGSYNYAFECSDGKYFNLTSTYIGLIVTEKGHSAIQEFFDKYWILLLIIGATIAGVMMMVLRSRKKKKRRASQQLSSKLSKTQEENFLKTIFIQLGGKLKSSTARLSRLIRKKPTIHRMKVSRSPPHPRLKVNVQLSSEDRLPRQFELNESLLKNLQIIIEILRAKKYLDLEEMQAQTTLSAQEVQQCLFFLSERQLILIRDARKGHPSQYGLIENFDQKWTQLINKRKNKKI